MKRYEDRERERGSMSQMDNIMAKRQKEMEEAYEAVWDEGRYGWCSERNGETW